MLLNEDEHRLDARAVEAAAMAHAENQGLDWSGFSEGQRRRRIRAMYVAVRAYLRELPRAQAAA